MRRAAAAAAAAVIAVAVSPAAWAAARGQNPPPFPRLPGGWSHAEINVRIARQPHTLILDRGRLVMVGQAQVELLESDGSLVTVPLSPATIITVNGRPGAWFDLRRRMIGVTMRIDGGAAVRLRATGLRR